MDNSKEVFRLIADIFPDVRESTYALLRCHNLLEDPSAYFTLSGLRLLRMAVENAKEEYEIQARYRTSIMDGIPEEWPSEEDVNRAAEALDRKLAKARDS